MLEHNKLTEAISLLLNPAHDADFLSQYRQGNAKKKPTRQNTFEVFHRVGLLTNKRPGLGRAAVYLVIRSNRRTRLKLELHRRGTLPHSKRIAISLLQILRTTLMAHYRWARCPEDFFDRATNANVFRRPTVQRETLFDWAVPADRLVQSRLAGELIEHSL